MEQIFSQNPVRVQPILEQSLPPSPSALPPHFTSFAATGGKKGGMDISVIDLVNVDRFADRVIALAEYRKELVEYLRSKMDSVAPNLADLVGAATRVAATGREAPLRNSSEL